MSALQWLALLAGIPAVAAFAYWTYARRESTALRWDHLALRAAALALLVLLLVDPAVDLPRVNRVSQRSDIIDASLSMRITDGNADSRWQRALHAADAGTVLLFGDAVASARRDTLDRVEPGAAHSRLLPALRAAAERHYHRHIAPTEQMI